MNGAKLHLEPFLNDDGTAAIRFRVTRDEAQIAHFFLEDRDLSRFQAALFTTIQRARALKANRQAGLPAATVRLDVTQPARDRGHLDWMRLRDTERPALRLETRE